MKIADEAVEAFTQYRRSQVSELRPWQSGDDMSGVSVSAEDAKAGSPKSGDMIARNPKNHADQWLVAAAYFADNFEPLAAIPHLSQGAVRVSEEMLIAAFLRGESWRRRNDVDRFMGVSEMVEKAAQDYADVTLSTLSPAPVGVTDEGQLPARAEAAAAAKLLLRCNGFDLDQWVGGDLMDDFPMDALKALASHEPAPAEKE